MSGKFATVKGYGKKKRKRVFHGYKTAQHTELQVSDDLFCKEVDIREKSLVNVCNIFFINLIYINSSTYLLVLTSKFGLFRRQTTSRRKRREFFMVEKQESILNLG